MITKIIDIEKLNTALRSELLRIMHPSEIPTGTVVSNEDFRTIFRNDIHNLNVALQMEWQKFFVLRPARSRKGKCDENDTVSTG